MNRFETDQIIGAIGTPDKRTYKVIKRSSERVWLKRLKESGRLTGDMFPKPVQIDENGNEFVELGRNIRLMATSTTRVFA